MSCESLSAALLEGRPPTVDEGAHLQTCASCARLGAALGALATPLLVDVPPAPTAASLDRAVRRARLGESAAAALGGTVLLAGVLALFSSSPPAAPLVAHTPAPAEAAADEALFAFVDGLSRLDEAPADLGTASLLDLLDPYASEPLIQFGEL